MKKCNEKMIFDLGRIETKAQDLDNLIFGYDLNQLEDGDFIQSDGQI